MKSKLQKQNIKAEATKFSHWMSNKRIKTLYGVTDGKAIGTYIEHQFKIFLQKRYKFNIGNSATGIDFPNQNIDIKTTCITQPQSSCPFKSARQKIFGLGYSILLFVYEKTDSLKGKTTHLKILHTIFIDKKHTADFQMTKMIRKMMDNNANEDDLIAYFQDRNLPIDEIEAHKIACQVLKVKLEQGYLTISNALQWRLQYKRAIDLAGTTEGLEKL